MERWGAGRVVPSEVDGPSDAAHWRSDGELASSSGSESDELGEGNRGKESADPLFAAELDDLDEKWVNKQRNNRRSDAILSCPCCLEIVTIDCQKHAAVDGQWRAMFVRNVKVNLRERWREADLNVNGDGDANATGSPQKDEFYHRTACATCGTQIGVQDKDEVYHFFNVLATNA